jgi:penicillin-binding protein 2
MFRRRYKRRTRGSEVSPEDIFLDTKNLPEFDTQQFEGRIEKPISKSTVRTLSFFFLAIGCVFVGKLALLQIARGDAYLKRSEANSYNSEPLFAERGVIYDRLGEELAWNTLVEGDSVPHRVYRTGGFGQILGYVSYPKRDSSGYFWQLEYEGKSGVEKLFQDTLAGINGATLASRNVEGTVATESSIVAPIPGQNVALSIDARVQESMYSSIKTLADSAGYDGGAGIVLDIYTGEVIALVSYPEYDATILSEGKDQRYYPWLRARPSQGVSQPCDLVVSTRLDLLSNHFSHLRPSTRISSRPRNKFSLPALLV